MIFLFYIICKIEKGVKNMEDILVTCGLKKYYGEGNTLTKALDGVDLVVKKGEFVAVVGASGSGKSTLLHMLGGLDNPTSGKVIVKGVEIKNLNRDELTIFRRREIGFIFQNYNLVPILNTYENIILPLELDGRIPDQQHIEKILHIMHLSEKKYSLPSQLSGGQQQRVAIARALASNPSIILADEPTGNLDSNTSQEVLGLMVESVHILNQTLIMITHNMQIAQLADRIICIEDGKIVER